MPGFVEIGSLVLLKKNLNSVNVFSRYFVIISPWKSVTLHLNKLEFPSPEDVLRLVEIGPVILEKKIFKFQYFFLLFRNYLPLEKVGALHLIKVEFPSP